MDKLDKIFVVQWLATFIIYVRSEAWWSVGFGAVAMVYLIGIIAWFIINFRYWGEINEPRP